jgi:hypothetical protein
VIEKAKYNIAGGQIESTIMVFGVNVYNNNNIIYITIKIIKIVIFLLFITFVYWVYILDHS